MYNIQYYTYWHVCIILYIVPYYLVLCEYARARVRTRVPRFEASSQPFREGGKHGRGTRTPCATDSRVYDGML